MPLVRASQRSAGMEGIKMFTADDLKNMGSGGFGGGGGDYSPRRP